MRSFFNNHSSETMKGNCPVGSPILRTATVVVFFMTISGYAQYDLTAGFSLSLNPNDVWSYNLSGVPLPNRGNGYDLEYWSLSGDVVGGIGKAVSKANTFWKDFEIGDVVIHVPTDPLWVDSITWTSPGTGLIDVSGAAWDAYLAPGRDATWSLTVSGLKVAERASVYGLQRASSGASFADNLLSGLELTSIPVNTGDVVEFAIRKPASLTYSQFVGVAMNVDFTAIPEPVSLAIGGGALLGFAGLRRLLRRH